MCKEVTLIYLNFLLKVLGVQEYYKTCIEFLANSKIFCILVLGAGNKKKRYTFNSKCSRDVQENPVTWHFRFPGQLTPLCITSLNIN